MLAKLELLEASYQDLEQQLSDPATLDNLDEWRKIAKNHADLTEIVNAYRDYKRTGTEIENTREMLREQLDNDLRQMAETELADLQEKQQRLEERLRIMLLPRDPRDDKNVILEIRGGTGGEEAALFAGDLFRMYSRYAERQGWKTEVMSAHPTDMGGFKEIIFQVNGSVCIQQAEVRERRAPGAADPGYRVRRAHPYLRGDGGGAAGSGRGGRKHRPLGDQDRHLLLQWARRAVGEHHPIGGAHHPPAHRHGGLLPGREVPAQEQG